MLIHGSATEGVATGWHELIASGVAILYAALKARDPATAAAETIYENVQAMEHVFQSRTKTKPLAALAKSRKFGKTTSHNQAQCSKCDRLFDSKKALDVHKGWSHPGEPATRIDEDGVTITIPKPFAAIKQTCETHNKNNCKDCGFACSCCPGKSWAIRSSAVAHYKKIHYDPFVAN